MAQKVNFWRNVIYILIKAKGRPSKIYSLKTYKILWIDYFGTNCRRSMHFGSYWENRFLRSKIIDENAMWKCQKKRGRNCELLVITKSRAWWFTNHTPIVVFLWFVSICQWFMKWFLLNKKRLWISLPFSKGCQRESFGFT